MGVFSFVTSKAWRASDGNIVGEFNVLAPFR
jgi:hypothetical protein